MNIYKGCSHGCIYCDSRSDCYGIDRFDQIRIKKDALSIIERDLAGKKQKGIIATGSMSDPYNFQEEVLGLTRGSLQLIEKYGFGINIATKSPLVTRDMDILTRIKKQAPAMVKITITTIDDTMSEKIEPRVAPTSARFAALKELHDAQIFTGILLMPVLPFITDTEENVMGIIERAAESKVDFIYPMFGMTLRENQRDWYFENLDRLFPGKKEKYLHSFGNRYECRSLNWERLYQQFQSTCKKYHILYDMQEIIAAHKKNYETLQLTFW